MTARHGHLSPPSSAPATGERFEAIARMGRVLIEQISSGDNDTPVAYDQAHDEWVVLLSGDATIEVDDGIHELHPGDWMLLPARLPHRVLRTARGTTWLAVHAG